jgi:antitoxin CptB
MTKPDLAAAVVPVMLACAANGQSVIDPLRKTRLRWRSRRGLLENDLVLTRFLDAQLETMTDGDVSGYDQLLELTDNELLDLILVRTELGEGEHDADVHRVLGWLRSA